MPSGSSHEETSDVQPPLTIEQLVTRIHALAQFAFNSNDRVTTDDALVSIIQMCQDTGIVDKDN